MEAATSSVQDSAGKEFTVPADTAPDQNGDPHALYLVSDADRNLTQCRGPNDTAPTGSVVWIPATGVGNDNMEKTLTGRFLRANSRVVFDPLGKPQVALDFNSEGGKLFDQLTSRLVGLPMAIFLDEDIISAPTILTRISDGKSVITGPTADEGRKLSIQLNSGALPITLRVIQESTVDATLGDDSVRHSVQAGEIAILAVMIFMILYYRLPGVLASLALVTYTSTVLMIFKLWPVTLTLAGIAAFVLSVGMAVDANVLVFERVKEELRAGRSLVTAVETGFNRAWTSIRDSNVSTLITCGILWWFGDQFGANLVKGFALTLAIGVLVSMFSAIVVTRTFLRLVVGKPLARRLSWFGAGVAGSAAAAAAGVPARQSVLDGSPARGGHFLDFVHRRGFYYLLVAGHPGAGRHLAVGTAGLEARYRVLCRHQLHRALRAVGERGRRAHGSGRPGSRRGARPAHQRGRLHFAHGGTAGGERRAAGGSGPALGAGQDRDWVAGPLRAADGARFQLGVVDRVAADRAQCRPRRGGGFGCDCALH